MLKSFLYAVLKVYIYIRSDWYEPVTFFVYRKSHFLLYKILRQGAYCPVDNGFAPTETECRLAEVRSRSMSCNCMTRTSQQECRDILELFFLAYI